MHKHPFIVLLIVLGCAGLISAGYVIATQDPVTPLTETPIPAGFVRVVGDEFSLVAPEAWRLETYSGSQYALADGSHVAAGRVPVNTGDAFNGLDFQVAYYEQRKNFSLESVLPLYVKDETFTTGELDIEGILGTRILGKTKDREGIEWEHVTYLLDVGDRVYALVANVRSGEEAQALLASAEEVMQSFATR